MREKLPFYLAYPSLAGYDDGRKDERDYDYLRSMYPELAKQAGIYVEEELDRMEYKDSMIYDEYPDRLQLRLMSGRIYDRMMREEAYAGKSEQVRDMVEIVMYEALMRRRRSRRRAGRITVRRSPEAGNEIIGIVR